LGRSAKRKILLFGQIYVCRRKAINSSYVREVMRNLKAKRNLVFTKAQLPPVGQDLLSIETALSQSDSVGLLCTSDQPNTETST